MFVCVCLHKYNVDFLQSWYRVHHTLWDHQLVWKPDGQVQDPDPEVDQNGREDYGNVDTPHRPPSHI